MSHSATGLMVVARALDQRTLDQVRRVCLSTAGEPAAVRPAGADRWAVVEEVRRAWEVSLPDDLHDRLVAAVETARPGMEACFGVALEPCDAVAALRYPPGAYYLSHRDVADHPTEDDVHRRAVSVVIFVNGGGAPGAGEFDGGLLRLLDADPGGAAIEVAPEAGTLVAFRSSVLHEVTAVSRGDRFTVVTWLLAGARAT